MCHFIYVSALHISSREAGQVSRQIKQEAAIPFRALGGKGEGSGFLLGHDCSCEFVKGDVNPAFFELDADKARGMERAFEIVRERSGGREFSIYAEWQDNGPRREFGKPIRISFDRLRHELAQHRIVKHRRLYVGKK